MTDQVPRIRMIAGPNGSGKSTIKAKLPASYIALFVNADEIEAELKENSAFDFERFELRPTFDELIAFYSKSEQLAKSGVDFDDWKFRLEGAKLQVSVANGPGYLAAAIADFAREELIKLNRSFTFETVMSHASKVKILTRAQSLGYRTYLYYVGTDDVEINIRRIKNRVAEGGHDVNEAKVRKRYQGSMDLLFDAIQQSCRAFIFDNSEENGNAILIAEFEDCALNYIQDEIPEWFGVEYLDKQL